MRKTSNRQIQYNVENFDKIHASSSASVRKKSSTVALVNQTALWALCFLHITHNMQARSWSLVSILALLSSAEPFVSMLPEPQNDNDLNS